MSYANQDIHNNAGPGSSAEPSMEEILASIRRILKEDEPGKPIEVEIPAAGAASSATLSAAPVSTAPVSTAPVDMDDDVLLLDETMIARPADFSSATTPPVEPLPAGEHPTTPLAPAGEALHFSSEPLPFARDYDQAARAFPEPAVELPDAVDNEPQPLPDTRFGAGAAGGDHDADAHTIPSLPEPEIARDSWAAWPQRTAEAEPEAVAADRGRLWDALPAQPDHTISAYAPEPDHTPIVAASELVSAPQAPPEYAAYPSAAPTNAEPTAQYEPEHDQEPEMNDSSENAYQPPENLISDQATNAAASSIGALVRSMTTEKSVAITKGSSITIEDIVRDEIRPLLKSWLDSHLPSLVERIVRTEIERVISRSVV
jgi:cell pole-organizing protein PopZ